MGHVIRLIRISLSVSVFSIIVGLSGHALAAAPDTSLPSGTFSPAPGGGFVSPALILPLNTKQPFVCARVVDGAVALTHRHQLCVCDGATWISENNGSVCDW